MKLLSWIIVAVLSIAAYAIYTAIINRSFLPCPHCGKIGAWRFDDIGTAVDEFDDDECLIRSTQHQICRACGGEVVHVWSDYEGRSIEKHGS